MNVMIKVHMVETKPFPLTDSLAVGGAKARFAYSNEKKLSRSHSVVYIRLVRP